MTARRLLVAALVPLALAGCAGTDAPAAESTAASTPADRSQPAEDAATASPAAPAEEAGQRIEVQVAAGQVTGDTGRVPVPLGEPVTLVVTSDAPDELHLHGYDLTADLPPGQPAEVRFDATVPGVFELELHDAGTVLLTLQVS
ncbi:hypothetical protein [Blastococcus saxobsidens]|uniref:EfeO-type cupredoxin-like domain-containing protein n=1 Tax=Blastococcus saxobsidens TaxID=138336 RepID=A0A4V2G1U0_9ACTN|nr:hypothetical protein [Blastococcus saxobsidens]RZU30556.1 hypothetical protein BKA19_0175 [Blastococcus saxobsidens]